MRLVFSLIMFSFIPVVFSQVILQPSLYSSAGGSVTLGDMQIGFSAGEPAVQTAVANGVIATQGFHQPFTRASFFDEPFMVSYVVENSCRGQAATGAITISVSGGLPPYSVFWNDITGDSTTFSRDELHQGNYTAIIKDSLMASDTLTITVGETDDCLKIYTGITPNGDGFNDAWYIGNIEFYTENKVELYSRWGNLVWETNRYDNQNNYWNGQDKSGNRLPDGTYFYVIQHVGAKTYKGWVEVTGNVK